MQYAYLTMTAGQRPGAAFVLRSDAENRIGRGLDCQIVLHDPLCSRVHAVVTRQGSEWFVRDGNSRNGTFVNGRSVREQLLRDEDQLRVGSTEFNFHQSSEPPTVTVEPEDLHPQETVVQEAPVGFLEHGVQPLADAESSADLLLLYQLAMRLMSASDPNGVIRMALDLLQAQTGAAAVGFLWINDAGQLEPKLIIPQEAAQGLRLSESLTRLVLQDRRAVWIASHQSGRPGDSLVQYADALCAPLVHQGRVVGAIHAYREQGSFQSSHFDFTISVANLTALALVRAFDDARLRSEYQRLRDVSPGCDQLVGESPPMRELKQKIEMVARSSGSVLVLGESGTGKELVAGALHRSSPRAERPMLAVNCAAIPADLVESQLFGHKAGSFTGANQDHVGYFQQADLGTLFLDELGELPPPGQAKLLRILEGQPFLPVGGVQEIRVDVRVIAATNQDLRRLVREKKFREDLFYRLNVFTLQIPPLRERADDVRRLVEFFFDRFRKQHGRPQLELTDSALEKLTSYHWPGNVRQLRNTIDSAVVLAIGDRLEPDDFELRDCGDTEAFESLRIDYWERQLIVKALTRSSRNVFEAAKLLGVSRATLYRKLEEYGIAR